VIANTRPRAGAQERAAIPAQRTPYHQLPEELRNVIDLARRHLAENLAAADGLPFDQVLEAIIAGHEAGWLTLVERNGSIELVPCFQDGTIVEGSYDFETAHRNAGGRS
jgi:hypothetical protein